MTPDDNQPDDLEQRLRDAFGQRAPGQDAESFLADVHRGAGRRRRRRVGGGLLATAAVLAVAAYGVSAAGVFDNDATNVADQDRTPATGTSATRPDSPSATPSAQPTEAGKGERVLSLSATDGDHQYVLMAGKFGCQGDCLKAYTTSDAGRSFAPTGTIGLTPSDPDPTTDTAYAIRFADEQDGWVYGGGLRATHDGGQTWIKPDLPVKGTVTGLEAWGTNAVAFVQTGDFGPTTVIRSQVGSDDWSVVDVGTPIRYADQLAASEDVTVMLASPNWASASNQIYVSTDGGHAWSGDRDPCEGTTYPSSISTGEGSIWTVCSPRKGMTGAEPFVSTDAGQTWSKAAGSFSPGTQVQARDATGAVVLDINKGDAALVTVDGPAQPILQGQGDYVPIGFTFPSTGYVLSIDYTDVLRTRDSGATWEPYPLP
jgi:hypothetical protein